MTVILIILYTGSIVDRKIPCYLIKSVSASVSNYCNIRANDLASEFQSRISLHELIFVYHGLFKNSRNADHSLEKVLKICYTMRLHPEDVSALKKIINWKLETMDKLVAVLEKFQDYQTLNASGRGSKLRLRRREAKSMTKAMFRQLGRCKEEYFNEYQENVMSNQISLQTLLDRNEQELNLTKLERNAALVAGVENTEELKLRYPDKFDSDILVNFVGAEISGKKANKQGDRLQKYIKSVKNGTSFDDPIQLKVCENIFDITSVRLRSSVCFTFGGVRRKL